MLPRILSGIIALFIANICCGADKLNVDILSGWSGYYRPSEWMPVEVGISGELSEPLEGTLQIRVKQDQLNTMIVRHRFVMTPGIPITLPLVLKAGYGVENCDVTILDDNGHIEWRNEFGLYDYSSPNKGVWPVLKNELLIGLVGSGKFGLRDLGERTHCKLDRLKGNVYVKSKLPRMCPWDWTGYSALDLLVLNNPDWQRFNRQQLKAIADWVSNGGRLLIILGSNYLSDNNPLTASLPFEISEPQEENLPTKLLREFNLDSDQTENLLCRRLMPSNQRFIDNARNGVDRGYLYLSAYVNFGKAAVLGFSPDSLSDAQTNNAPRFWVGIMKSLLKDAPDIQGEGKNLPRNATELSGAQPTTGNTDSENISTHFRTIEYGRIEDGITERNYNASTTQLGNNGIIGYMYNLPQLKPMSVWWVVLMMLSLAFLIGPVDYLVLKRLDRLPLTWVTSFFWILVFTGGAYFGVQAIRGGKMILKVVSVKDGIKEGGLTWSSTYTGLFSPKSDVYEFDGVREKQWWSGIAPKNQNTRVSNNPGLSDRNLVFRQHDGGNLPDATKINIWTMQCMVCESPAAQMPIDAQVRCDGEQLSMDLVNYSMHPIKNGYVVFREGVFEFGSVPPESTRSFTGAFESSPNWSNDLSLYIKDRISSFSGISMLRPETIYFAQGTLRRTQAMIRYLARGAAIVCVKYENGDDPLKVRDTEYTFSHIELARLVVFPQNTNALNRNDRN